MFLPLYGEGGFSLASEYIEQINTGQEISSQMSSADVELFAIAPGTGFFVLAVVATDRSSYYFL